MFRNKCYVVKFNNTIQHHICKTNLIVFKKSLQNQPEGSKNVANVFIIHT